MGSVSWALSVVRSETARLKRQVVVGPGGPGGLVGSGEVCVLSCLTVFPAFPWAEEKELVKMMMMKAMSGRMGEWSEEPSGLLAASLFSEEHLEEFCGIYRGGKGCMTGCPATNTQTMLLKAFASLDFLCITKYDELRSHLPCFQASHEQVSPSLSASPQLSYTIKYQGFPGYV